MTIQVYQRDRDGVQGVANTDTAGASITWAADTEEDYLNLGEVLLVITKGAGNATMTVSSQVSLHGVPLQDVTVSIPRNETTFFVADPRVHNEQTGADIDHASIQFDNVTGLEVIAVRVDV